MIKAVMTTDHAVVRVHDEYVCEDVNTVMPQLDRIVSAAYKRRLNEGVQVPRRSIH